MKKWIFVFLALSFAASGVVGCTNNSASISPADTQPTRNLHQQKIVVWSSVVGKGQAHFEGTTEFYNATLQTQLYQEDKPLDWWPADREIKAERHLWEITVTYEEELSPEFDYYIKIWVKDDPSRYGVYWFDFQGPPEPEP